MVAGAIGVPTILIITAIVIGPFAYARGWILNRLWDWFVVPKFGLPHLGVATAVGLSVIIAFVTPYGWEDKEKSTTAKIISAILSLALPLLFGWIVHRFFM
jgi:hypothetical protein